MISKKVAKKKLKELQKNEFGSGYFASTLRKIEDRPPNCGHKNEKKPTLDELDRQ